MNRHELLTSVADEVSLIVAGALAANGEDDNAYWEFVQKLRHTHTLPLLTEAEVQAAIQRYYALTRTQQPPAASAANSAALEPLSADRHGPITRADLRAVVVVEATLRIDSAVTLPMIQETDTLLTQLGTSLARLYQQHLLSSQLVVLIEATGYRFADLSPLGRTTSDRLQDQEGTTRADRDGKPARAASGWGQ